MIFLCHKTLRVVTHKTEISCASTIYQLKVREDFENMNEFVSVFFYSLI